MIIERKIEQYEDAFYAHGYIVSASPVEGEEELFLNHLREGFAKVEAVLEINAKRYGYRGLSANALNALHIDLARPCWAVEVR